MSYATRLLLIRTSTSIEEETHQRIEGLWEKQSAALRQVVVNFLAAEITPAAMFDFETQIAEQIREFARQVVEQVLNQIEADDPQQMPHDVNYEADGYRRLNRKTRNAHVATLFGSIALYRYPYRYWHRETVEACPFPLEIALGLVEGATPALAEAVGRYMAPAGAAPQSVLDRSRAQHGVTGASHGCAR